MSARRSLRPVAAAAAALLAAAPAPAQEAWPQWRGPGRDGRTGALRHLERWPALPEQVWRVAVGGGHAGPVVAGGRVFVFSRVGEREVVRALDLASGAELWRDGSPAPYTPAPEAAEHGAGPFSTPAVAGGRVFSFGMTQALSAHDADSGELLWRHRYRADYAEYDEYPVVGPLYGTSLSPLVDGGRVVVYAGRPGDGVLVAHDAATGAVLWRLAGDGPPYGSPVAADLGGVRQIVTLSQARLIGVAADSGELLWERAFPVEWDNTTATPIVSDGVVILSSYGVGVHALRPRPGAGGWRVVEEWRTREVSAFMSNPVLDAGTLYGFSHRNRGQLFALDAASGEILWTTPGRLAENAYLVLAGGWLLSLDEAGRLRVGRASPDAWRETASVDLSDAPVWAHPAVVGERLLVKDATALTVWWVGGGTSAGTAEGSPPAVPGSD